MKQGHGRRCPNCTKYMTLRYLKNKRGGTHYLCRKCGNRTEYIEKEELK